MFDCDTCQHFHGEEISSGLQEELPVLRVKTSKCPKNGVDVLKMATMMSEVGNFSFSLRRFMHKVSLIHFPYSEMNGL